MKTEVPMQRQRWKVDVEDESARNYDLRRSISKVEDEEQIRENGLALILKLGKCSSAFLAWLDS